MIRARFPANRDTGRSYGYSAVRAPPRRILALGVALVATSAASAAFQPIERRHGELEIPRVRAGTITIPDAHRSGRVTVILTLADPPLAAYSRTLAGSSGTRRLNVQSRGARPTPRSSSRRSGRDRLAEARDPAATVKRNYTLLLNGMAVELPATELAKAAKLSFARKLYPSYRYALALNRSPGLIGAGALAAGGGSGEGMKIVVDDGVDPKNAFFNPEGYSYPAGFPKGGTKWTSPKVIVARSFVGAGADERTPLAVDPQASFHGTHVAGIAAGNAGTTAPAAPTTPHDRALGRRAEGVHRQLPRLQRADPGRPRRQHTRDRRRLRSGRPGRDGRDQLLRRRPADRSLSDALVEAVRNVAAAGVVPVISAGNDRDDYGVGSAGSPGAPRRDLGRRARTRTSSRPRCR